MSQAWRPDVDLVIGSMVSQEWPRINDMLATCSRRLGRAARGWQRAYVDFFARRLPAIPAPPPPQPPTLVLAPDLADVGSVDFRKAKEAIAAGERAVAARLDDLRALLRAR
jgi:predicted acylesterase/phospholipase RssA